MPRGPDRPRAAGNPQPGTKRGRGFLYRTKQGRLMPTTTPKKKPPEKVVPPEPASGGDPVPPLPGSVEEMIATAKVVGYGPGVPDGPAETCRDIEMIIYARLGWAR